MFGKEAHSRIYFFSLACLAASLPLSIFATSLFQIVLAGNWLLEGRYREKWNLFRTRKSIWLILSIYVVFLLGLIYTHDFKYAFQRVKKARVDDISINVVDLDDLILLKKEAVKGRKKSRDKEDLSFLEKLKAKLR